MAEPLIYHCIEFRPADPAEKLRDSIGGPPYLPKGMEVPSCSCGRRMDLYLQFDLREEFGLPFRAGSHLTVFMCEACNGMPDILYEPFYLDRATAKTQDRLPAGYWDLNGSEWEGVWTRFYRLMLLEPEGEFEFAAPSGFIQPCSLTFEKKQEVWEPDPHAPGWAPEDEEIDFRSEPGLPGTTAAISAMQYNSPDFKVGGQPPWGGDNSPPQDLLCSCGSPMAFVCYVPSETLFPNPKASEYNWERVGSLFTGLGVYILACRAQCHPFAVYPVTMP